jgi:hypothetical protein
MWACRYNLGSIAKIARCETGAVAQSAVELYRSPAQELPNVATEHINILLLGTDVYWRQDGAIWNNAGDTVYLYDGARVLVDSCTY